MRTTSFMPPRAASPVSTPIPPEGLLLIAMMACPFLAFLRPSMWWLAAAPPMVAGLAYLVHRRSQLRSIAAFWVIFFTAVVLYVPWPLSFVAPLVAIFVMA